MGIQNISFNRKRNGDMPSPFTIWLQNQLIDFFFFFLYYTFMNINKCLETKGQGGWGKENFLEQKDGGWGTNSF